MIKLVDVVKRRSDLSPEEFRTSWLDKHGPLVRSLGPDLGARRYEHTMFE
jgi:hypothetical protein